MQYRLLNITTNKKNIVNKAKEGIEYQVQPRFGRKINSNGKDIFELILKFDLHDRDGIQSPFDIDLEISGIFQLKDFDESEIDSFMKINAVSIMFPYLRTILASSMTSMMLQPITIPILDASQLFIDSNEDK